MQDGGSGAVDKQENSMSKVRYLQRSESLLLSEVSPLLLPQLPPTAPIPSKRKCGQLFLAPTTYIPSRMHTRSEFLFCYCKWEFRPY